MSHLLEHFFGKPPNGVVIVNDKNAKPMRSLHPDRSDLTHFGRSDRAAEPHMDGSAFAECAFDRHCPADLPSEAVHHRETQPASLPWTLGGEERVERFG